MRFVRSLIATVAGALAGACGAQQPAPVETRPVAFVGVTVLPMTRAERLIDQTVVTAGDRIVAVGPRKSVAVPAGAEVIDGRGKTLMPGLVDMHMHLSPDPGAPGDSTQRALAITLAHGITTARTMLGQKSHPAVRAAIEQGTLAGPRLYIASTALNDGNTKTPEDARAAVDAAKAAGFDLIKSHQISSVPVWTAVQDEARKLDMPVAGHVDNAIGLDRAMAAGQEIEHLDASLAELLPAEASRDFAQLPPPEIIDALAGVGQSQIDALAARVARAHSYQVPTLAAIEQLSAIDRTPKTLLAAEDARYVADWVQQQWVQQREGLVEAGFTAAHAGKLKALRRRLTGAYFKAGVPIMAGSDTPHSFHVWGVGLIREIEDLSAAGLGPMAALRAATVVPRDYLRGLPVQGSALGWKADFGTVEPGAHADLVLYDRDPSSDLSALHSPAAVVAGGRLYERAQLNALLDRAAADGKKQPPPK